MPLQIMNEKLYHDRTVQDWHRRVLPPDADAIDIDLFGMCRRSYCRDPLYFIEATTNPNKPTTILRRLAEKADAYGIVAEHDTDGITGFRVVFDPTKGKTPEIACERPGDALAVLLLWIRKFHAETTHAVA